MNAYLETLVSNVHCGFLIQYATWLDSIMEKCCKFLDKGVLSGFLVTNLSKVFDCVDRDLLIAKMHVYGFYIKSLKFIESCFARRKQKVKINSCLSE